MKAPDSNDAKDAPPPTGTPKANWLLILGLLLGPAAMTWVAVAANWEAVAVGAMFTSFVTPLICAWMLAQRLTRTNNSFGITFLGLAMLLVPLSVGLCFGGCILGAKFLE